VLLTNTKKGNNIGATGASALANALRENKSITTLYLYGKYFFLFSPLCFSPTPKKTTILETQGPLHWPMLCVKTKASLLLTFIVSIFYLLSHVLLTNTKKGNNIGATGATALANALHENKSITNLDLRCKYFLLFSLLCFSPTPKKPTILETQGPVHWPMLYMKTKASPLFTLEVSIFFFSFVLRINTKKDINIGDTGATALANALRENKSITTLYLSCKYFFLFSPLCFSPTPKKTTILEKMQKLK